MNTKTAGLLVIALIIVVGTGIFSFSGKAKNEMEISVSPTPEAKVSISPSYKDGVYEQIGNYTSPGGPEEIDVKLTLSKGIVTESEVTLKAELPISKMKQEAFAKEYKMYVVGKNIKDLQLGKIAGSSLTPKGFNDALQKIRMQAQS